MHTNCFLLSTKLFIALFTILTLEASLLLITNTNTIADA